jgi:glycosyltransferase involved in cell wall biosynthesis
VIFLSEHARNAVMRIVPELPRYHATVPHGVNPRFSRPPRTQRRLAEFSDAAPCRIVYVSAVDPYKHQCEVARAVTLLRAEGFWLALTLAGPPGHSVRELREEMRRLDPAGDFISYEGEMPYEAVHELYATADIGVFASSCETFGLILLEGMSAGLPIACANRSAMPEILGGAGLYFDPEQPAEIASAIRTFMESPSLRSEKADAAFNRAKAFTWQRCAEETFRFLSDTARRSAA